MKKLTILGSTGSIGTQALETIDLLGGYRVSALTAGKNAALMEAQARRYKPVAVAMADENAAEDLRIRLADTDIRVLSGESGVVEAARLDADVTLSSIVGIAGLRPTMASIREGNRRIALANKETLVCAGRLFTKAIEDFGCELLPVDSEHSAIFQSLMSGSHGEIKKILLTASGGPFRTLSREALRDVTPEMALRHPNWSMGAKITIDSATMMNKGLEVIEAMHLFDVPVDKIRIVVHPQSIVHSAVEFTDNAIVAQLGAPDMRIPIQLALTYPERRPSLAPEIDLAALAALTFENPDTEKFRCLKIALDAARRTDAATVVMNAANETAVRQFLEGKIGFTDIPDIIEKAIDDYGRLPVTTIDEVLNADKEARRY